MQFCNFFVILTIVIITICNFLKVVAVIFKNLNVFNYIKNVIDANYPQKLFKFIKTNRILVKAICVCLVCIFSVLVSIVSVGITFGFKVKYSGKSIAIVKDTQTFDDAKEIAKVSINDKEAEKAIKKPQFSLTLTVVDRLEDELTVAKAIIESTVNISEGSVLKVNGEKLICAKSDELTAILEESRCRYFIEGAENSAKFVDEVEVENGYYLKEKIEDIEKVKETILALEVETVSNLISDVKIAFKTTKVQTSAQLIGYSKVTVAGKNGINRKNEIIKTVNGEVIERTLVSEEVISEPVNQVVTVGTAISMATATEKAEASAQGFILPISKGKYKVTSYWGDGRGHKGLDLAAPKGTAIFAVASGTVVESSYQSQYGYYVTIDHGNGIKTRYAHASALCVKKGAKVSQGDMIAAVGSTGRSTGNHLHFEVYKNGTRVDPTPYLKSL